MRAQSKGRYGPRRRWWLSRRQSCMRATARVAQNEKGRGDCRGLRGRAWSSLDVVVRGRAVLLAEVGLEHLAEVVPRQFVHDGDVLRRLERSQAALAVLDDLVRRD